MRKELKAIGNQERHTFIGEFIREGFKNSYRGLLKTTISLRNIRLDETDKVVTIRWRDTYRLVCGMKAIFSIQFPQIFFTNDIIKVMI